MKIKNKSEPINERKMFSRNRSEASLETLVFSRGELSVIETALYEYYLGQKRDLHPNFTEAFRTRHVLRMVRYVLNWPVLGAVNGLRLRTKEIQESEKFLDRVSDEDLDNKYNRRFGQKRM